MPMPWQKIAEIVNKDLADKVKTSKSKNKKKKRSLKG
jgi:hypothetical protein